MSPSRRPRRILVLALGAAVTLGLARRRRQRSRGLGDGGDLSGDREPRKPLAPSGAGSAALDVPAD